MTYHRQIQGLGSSATLPATIPVIVDGHMGDPPSTNPLVVLGLAAAAAFVLYKVLGSSMSRNPPPGYGLTYKTPYYGDAMYAEEVLDFSSKNDRLPRDLDSVVFRSGTRALAQMMEASKRAEMSPGRKVADPIDVDWGRMERRKIVARSGTLRGEVDPGYARAFRDERSVSVSDPRVVSSRTYGHPTIPMSRRFDKPAHMMFMAPSGDYWSMKRNGRSRSRR